MLQEVENHQGLYRPEFEHDACGIGFRANMKGHKSHQIVQDAIHMLERMDHRGACGCDPNTGDGAGILIQIPHEYFLEQCSKLGFQLPEAGKYGVGMIFFPQDEKIREVCRTILNRQIKKLGMSLLGYRKVPTLNDTLGEGSLSVEPYVEQVFIGQPDDITEELAFERKLFILRQVVGRLVVESEPAAKPYFYFSSMSCRTISYKGQLTTNQLRYYFPDLENESVVSAFGIVHSRFSTNTFPSWRLAQPFRYIAHNGEINTVKGNVNWIRAGEKSFASEFFTREEMDMILPICDKDQSDSANLDNAIELLYLSGRSLPHVMMMLVPEAWDGNEDMDPERRAFYEYHATIMEPWDGPASLSFTDGKMVGATLDRNGLRPSRYWVLNDDTIIMASEAGVLENVDQSKVVVKGRLQPGKMFVVDMEQGRIVPDEELKAQICSQKPYQEWLDTYKLKVEELDQPVRMFRPYSDKSLIKRQLAFGFTSEDLRMILAPMGQTGAEAIGSMGVDSPIAILSENSQHLSSYFKQLFAQVTNPPIDSIRERSIMSLISYVGATNNILAEDPIHCRQIELKQPVLTVQEFDKLRFVDTNHFQAKTINIYYRADEGEAGLERALRRICRYAADAIEDGFEIIILSDRAIDSDHAAIPSLLAVSAVHHFLIRKGLRGNIGLLAEVGDAWETHHFATLIGYGASGINPYMAFETISYMNRNGMIDGEFTDEKLHYNYIKAVNKELLKIFSKMGISTLQSYQGAQIFECLGLNKDVVDRYFTGTISRIGGLGLKEIAKEVSVRHKLAFPEEPIAEPRLEVGGVYQWKQRGEAHIFNPQTVHLLQHSTKTNDYSLFKKYTKLIDDQSQKALTLRGLLKFRKATPVPIDEVEPVESIFKRFATGAMSFGSISWEAHTTLAIAMNRIGGKSNSGEGGEDAMRFSPLENGDSLNSSIKQVASGRFGVTSHYLSNATELQIKMAQGAKPGEGGQLPGHKVDDWIGRTRHSTPGVGLISPPPHHDIYSIEDLAQLIYDLKNANRKARISVKLVSEAGVGTIAAGVAKAHADHILISGYDGGTGASPLSSIRHAGLPWELGLAEAHQTLVKNKLRGRVTVQADGQIRTGRDLAIAILLGAEEFGVATAALVAAGCIMMRKCHLNTCPVGVATQRKELRALFSGKPEYVVNMFTFMAQELREVMASLGFRTINEMVGQTQLLEVRKDLTHWKHKNLNFDAILHKEAAGMDVALFKQEEQDHGIDNVLDWKLIEVAEKALENKEEVSGEFSINNLDRSVGNMLSNEISKRYGGEGLPKGTIHYKFRGTAGQSFGAFSTSGLKLELEGDANDYFGKGLCGAELIAYPDRDATFKPEENIIIGNVAFYGATSGEAYLRGTAGERFCVRNSGAKVVVEGVGDHGLEYMTGGLAIILGTTGRNFAAGMSGGVAYVLDVDGTFNDKVNKEMVELESLNEEDSRILKSYVERHLQYTGSNVAFQLMQDWEKGLAQFVKVMPVDFKKALESRGISLEQQIADKNVVYKDIVVDVH